MQAHGTTPPRHLRRSSGAISPSTGSSRAPSVPPMLSFSQAKANLSASPFVIDGPWPAMKTSDSKWTRGVWPEAPKTQKFQFGYGKKRFQPKVLGLLTANDSSKSYIVHMLDFKTLLGKTCFWLTGRRSFGRPGPFCR